MIQAGSKLFVTGAMVLAAMSLGGCATKKYAREQAAIVGQAVNTRVDATDTHVAAVEGTAKDAKGKVKEAAGKAVGNPNLRDEGRADQTEGKVQKKIGDVEKVFNR